MFTSLYGRSGNECANILGQFFSDFRLSEVHGMPTPKTVKLDSVAEWYRQRMLNLLSPGALQKRVIHASQHQHLEIRIQRQGRFRSRQWRPQLRRAGTLFDCNSHSFFDCRGRHGGRCVIPTLIHGTRIMVVRRIPVTQRLPGSAHLKIKKVRAITQCVSEIVQHRWYSGLLWRLHSASIQLIKHYITLLEEVLAELTRSNNQCFLVNFPGSYPRKP